MPTRVEEVLLAHSGVAECAVVGIPDAQWGETVQAFIVRREPSLDAATLERYVRDSDLSSYQRPRNYHFVAELPRTSTNKVLRRVLRENVLAATGTSDESSYPAQSMGRK
jgi:acyl-coenzyme A synthetase/AMP-(fatty) acid ligase